MLSVSAWLFLWERPSAGATPSFTVNSTLDEHLSAASGGDCVSTPSGVCTLRAAVEGINNLGSGNIGVPAGTYVLHLGPIEITGAPTISGAGAGSTIIDGGGVNRVFELSNAAFAYIEKVTAQHGLGTPGIASHGHGGCIHNHGQLILVDSTVRSCTAEAGWGGGGIANASVGTITLVNDTITNNVASTQGGGLDNGGSATLANVTISNNSGASAGGMNSSGRMQINNTIVANNTPDNCGTTVIVEAPGSGHNLDSANSCGFTAAGDVHDVDPLLGALQSDGTLPLQAGSPAIDTGDTAPANCPATDERGLARPQDGDGNGTAQCDIGAYEALPLPPTSTSPPVIAGKATQGQLLTETHGGWTGSPSLFGYQWEDCDSSGGACAAIAGATGQTYVLTASDAGHTVRVQESATNAGGTGPPASSTPTTMVVPLPPTSTSPPVIAGKATQGQLLTETHGGWTGSPSLFGYQWEDCDSSGGACAAIAGGRGQTYVLTASDAGHTVRVQESATNAGGTGPPASSTATGVVQASSTPTPPANSAPPAVSGTATVGQKLSSSTGAWSGTPPLSYTYQWQLCKPACANVAGATQASYTLVAADLGARMRVVLRASNAAGHASAESSQVGPVAPGPSQIKALPLKEFLPTGKSAKIAALLRKGGYSFVLRAPTACKIVISWYMVPKGAHVTKGMIKPVLVAVGNATFSRAGTQKITIRLTAPGKRLLKHAERLKLTAKWTFTTAANHAVVAATKTFTLTR